MAIVSISRIQHRRGLQQDVPQLASAELGWALDSQKLYIGNGPILEGSPRVGNTEILTEHSDILRLAQSYTFLNEDAGYTPTTGGKNNKFTSIAYGNGIYVMVGTNGALLTSTDSVNWTPVYGGTNNSLNSVCFGYVGPTGYFIAVGASGTIIYSTDGAVWNTSSTTVLLTLTSIVWASALSIFVATSNSGSIIISSDANTWTTIVSGSPAAPPAVQSGYTRTIESLNSVAYYDGLIVAVGNAGTIITSIDGINWVVQDTPTSYNLKTISWATTDSPVVGDGQWTAAGDYSTVLISMDATSWIFGFTDTFRAAAHNTGIWVFVGDGGVIYKSSGSQGTTLVQAASATTTNLYDIVYSTVDVQFVAVGANGTILTSQSGTIWATQTSNTSLDLNKIIHDEANNLYIAVGESGIILTSPDAITWTIRTSGVADNLYGIAIWPDAGTYSYIAVGDNNAITRCTNVLGTVWTKVTTGFLYDLRSITVANLSGGSYKAIAVGLNGSILFSTNSGQAWADLTGVSGTTEDLNSINYITWTSAAGITLSKFFVVGNNATVISSDIGSSWSTPLDGIPATNHMFNIYYGLSNFWVVGSVGYSTLYGTDILDVATLTSQSLLLSFSSIYGFSGPAFNSSNYGIGKFVLFGQYDSILVSDDGQNYISQPTRNFVTTNLNAADIYGSIIVSSRFIAVGNKGLVLDSTDAITWNGRSYVYGNAKTTRSIQHKLDDFVSVKDFGAKGDGLTDDTECINRALYEIYCRTVDPAARKVLHFPAGRYIISDGINVPSNAVIRGEGMNNTIIQQTADPTFIPYVITTADSMQQIGAQLGYNGATLPSDIIIEDIALESTADSVYLIQASRIVLSRVRMTGGTNLPTTNGNEWVAIYIIGASLTIPADVNVVDCYIEKFNYGVFQPDTELSRNIVFNSTTFSNLYKGLFLCDGGGQVNTMTISNCVFDLIYDRAIDANYVTNITSTFNSYRDVGNSRGNSPVTEVIKFGTNSIGCASINDQFDRSETSALTMPWVVGNAQTSAWFGGHNLRVGYYSQQGGEIHTLLPGVTSQSVLFDGTATPLTYTIMDSSYNQRIQYMIIRDSYTRSGVLQLAYNPTTKAYTIDDESSETGDVGVVFSLSSDNIVLTLKYTSTSGAATVFTLALAESFVKTSW
jgi:hypothetical protein